MKSSLPFLCVVFFSIILPLEGSSQGPDLIFADVSAMSRARAAIERGQSDYVAQLKVLRAEAEQALQTPPHSVMDKPFLPPSGDKHDYISQGPYWWPDPEKADGLPYIRRDGEVNPEVRKFTDHTYFGDLMGNVDVLAKTYYFTGEERYAEKAAQILRVWFIDEATRMNPNLNFGQGIPGRMEGRGIGIIETRRLYQITDGVALLRPSSHWTESHEQGIQQWMRSYLDWLLNSQHGKDEMVHPNNHGTWYDVQVGALAIFTGQEAIARERITAAKKLRMDAHLAANGEQPHETARTKGWGYSVMNLLGLFHIAMLGDRLDIDLWSYRNANGATLQDGLDYLIPLTLGKEPLPFQQISPVQPENLLPHLEIAAKVYDEKRYLKIARKIRKKYAEKRDYWGLVY